MSRVLVRMGDIFEGSAQLTVLPCSGKGTVSSAVRRWLTMFDIPAPKDIPSRPQFGDISESVLFKGEQSITKRIVYAASVLNDYSSFDVIKNIAAKLGELTQANSDMRLIETPLLGTGAGGLPTEVAGKALYQGFTSTAHPDSTLYIFVFDRERQTVLQSLINSLEDGSTTEVPSKTVHSVLFLSAEPTNASRLRLGEEFREIQGNLKSAQYGSRFKLELPQLSLRPNDIIRVMIEVKPSIVHFSGHGSSTGALCFENESGEAHYVQPDALAALFRQFAGQTDCVLLNACYSQTQAIAIAKHIQYVIGMNKAIGDKAAIAFAMGFYQALGGESFIDIARAFEFGCVAIQLLNIPEHLTPVLIKEGHVIAS